MHRLGDAAKANTEELIATRLAEHLRRTGTPIGELRTGDSQIGEPDFVADWPTRIGIEVTAAIGDDDYSARLSAWLKANPQPVPVHSSSASNEMPEPRLMAVRRPSVVLEAQRVLAKHMTRPYAPWSYLAINLSHDPAEPTDVIWIADRVPVPDESTFLGVYLCYVTDRLFERKFRPLVRQTR